MAAKMVPPQDVHEMKETHEQPNLMPKPAWGKIVQPVAAASLSEVMSEQLATDIQEKQCQQKQKKETIDEALAKELQDEENAISNSIENSGSCTDNANKLDEADKFLEFEAGRGEIDAPFMESLDTNDDFLIAQMLQNQFDNEYDTVITNEEKAHNQNSKIKVSYEKYKVLQSNHPIWEDSDDEDPELLAYLEMDDRKRNWDYLEAADKESPSMPRYTPSWEIDAYQHDLTRCGYQKIGGSIVTKHDKDINHRANGKRMMAMAPGIQTGDGGAFDMKLSNSVYNELKKFSIKDGRRRAGKIKDKIEKSTTEQAVDPQTKLILFKLINNGILENVNGVISTGKEAVLLHAEGGPGPEPEQATHSKGGNIEFEAEPMNVPKECVIKVFKTTLNEFKNREIYIRDDYRFRDRFSKQNPRKVIHMWAEKELHNLVKMSRHGLRVPDAVLLKKHVLVMSFIGHEGKPAPKLKDANLSYADLEIAYDETVEMMTQLYNTCHLVHADLSEYNILWHDGQCWFIDVSQSVEPTHPHGLEFLYRDCVNVTTFFQKKGIVQCNSPQSLFANVSGLPLVTDEYCPKSETEILERVRGFQRSQEILSLSSNGMEEDAYADSDMLNDFEDEKNSEVFKNLRIQDNQSGTQYPFDYCWEQSLKQKQSGNELEKCNAASAPLPIIPGHANQKGGKSSRSPKGGASFIISKSPSATSKSPKSPKSGASLASMTSEELVKLKEELEEDNKDGNVTKNVNDRKQMQVNFKLEDQP